MARLVLAMMHLFDPRQQPDVLHATLAFRQARSTSHSLASDVIVASLPGRGLSSSAATKGPIPLREFVAQFLELKKSFSNSLAQL